VTVFVSLEKSGYSFFILRGFNSEVHTGYVATNAAI
jgi:hypothetical protein